MNWYEVEYTDETGATHLWYAYSSYPNVAKIETIWNARPLVDEITHVRVVAEEDVQSPRTHDLVPQ